MNSSLCINTNYILSQVIMTQLICQLSQSCNINMKSQQQAEQSLYLKENSQIWKQYCTENNEDFLQDDFTPAISHLFIKEISKTIVTLSYRCIPTTMLISQKWNRSHLSKDRSFAFIAKKQSQGKGQKSNIWASPEGNMYLTLLTKAENTIWTKLTMFTVTAMLQTAAHRIDDRRQLKCKWVNDITLNQRKLGGCLLRVETPGYAQLGVGINIGSSPIAGSTHLQHYCKQQINIHQFTQQFLTNLCIFLNSSVCQKIQQTYQRSLLYLEDYICIWDDQLKTVLHEGIFKGINSDGHAILQVNNHLTTVSSGRMRKKTQQSEYKPLDLPSIMAQL